MITIGVTGVPGAGKTTLTRALSSRMRETEDLARVEIVSEYARRYISKHGHIEEMWEQMRILKKQIEWEESVKSPKLDVLLSDSPVFLGFIYCMDLPKDSSKSVMCFNDIFKEMLKVNTPKARYDIVLHLGPSYLPVDDGVRKKEYFLEATRDRMNEKIKVVVRDLFPPILFHEVSSLSLEDRVKESLGIIRDYKENIG